MAVLDPSGIVNGQPVLAPQVSNLYNALNGNASYDLIVNGDLTVSSNGVIYGGSISGSSFTGSGLSLTGVITDTLSGSFLTTASFQTFSSSFVTTSESLASRIVSNDTDITNLFAASQSLEAGQQALENFSASLIIDHLNDVTTVGGAFQALDGNVLVYDGSVSKWRPSRSNVNVNITGSTTIEGSTTFTGNIAGTGDLNLTGATNLNGNSSITGSTNITGTTTIVGSTHLTGSGNISGSLDVSGPTALTGALAIVGDTTTTGDINITGNLTASNDISASGDMFATTGSFLHLDLNAGGNVSGDLFIDGNITASGVISASGDVYADDIVLGTGRISTAGSTTPIDFSSTSLMGIVNLTASNNISASGDVLGNTLTSAGTITAGVGSYVITDNLRAHPGDVITVADNLNVTGNITASQDISASGDLHGGGLIVEGSGAITGSLFVSGSSTSVQLSPEDQFTVNTDNIALTSSINFGILGSPNITGALTASAGISASFIRTTTGTSNIYGTTVNMSASVFDFQATGFDIGGGQFTVETEVFEVTNVSITASHDISASGDVYGRTGSFAYLDLSDTIVSGSSITSNFGPATSVTITHNLNKDYPIVQVYTASNRSVIVPDSIISDDANNISFTFAINTTGSITILK